jgi:hypothetical protein
LFVRELGLDDRRLRLWRYLDHPQTEQHGRMVRVKVRADQVVVKTEQHGAAGPTSAAVTRDNERLEAVGGSGITSGARLRQISVVWLCGGIDDEALVTHIDRGRASSAEAEERDQAVAAGHVPAEMQ